jgi:predicted transcriptional regulator
MSETILQLTANIVSAQLAKTPTETPDLLALIRSVHAALSNADKPVEEVTAQQPAVPVRKSVFPDFIVCLEDGKKLKMLKRHLKASFNLTPDEYRAKWGLPRDYPMTAPAYAQIRSGLAKTIGLGRKPTAVADEPVVQKIPARKTRRTLG